LAGTVDKVAGMRVVWGAVDWAALVLLLCGVVWWLMQRFVLEHTGL
jgi:hypothetical protein